MMVSNPMSVRRVTFPDLLPALTTMFIIQDFLSHNRWKLQQRCYYTDFYNATVCAAAYEQLPFCLEAVQMAYTLGTVASRTAAIKSCGAMTPDSIEGRSLENVDVRVSSMRNHARAVLMPRL